MGGDPPGLATVRRLDALGRRAAPFCIRWGPVTPVLVRRKQTALEVKAEQGMVLGNGNMIGGNRRLAQASIVYLNCTPRDIELVVRLLRGKAMKGVSAIATEILPLG